MLRFIFESVRNNKCCVHPVVHPGLEKRQRRSELSSCKDGGGEKRHINANTNPTASSENMSQLDTNNRKEADETFWKRSCF